MHNPAGKQDSGAGAGAWAAQLIRDTYRDSEPDRDERFLENALVRWANSSVQNMRRFLRALGTSKAPSIRPEDAHMVSQDASSEDQRRPDIEVRHSGSEGPLTLELKAWAGFTPKQLAPDYADCFIVPRGKIQDMRGQVHGDLISWEDLFECMLRGPEPSDEPLKRLKAFYEGITYGVGLVPWPETLDRDRLQALRAKAHKCIEMFESRTVAKSVDWHPVHWFNGRLRSEDSTSATAEWLSWDPQHEQFWWLGTGERTSGRTWWPESNNSEGNSELQELARAMTELWRTVVGTGLGMAEHRSGRRERRYEGDTFGRTFSFQTQHGYSVDVLLTFDQNYDARVIGLQVQKGLDEDGRWERVGGAWWPKEATTDTDTWVKEVVTVARRCAEGKARDAFQSLEHAVDVHPAPKEHGIHQL